MSLPSAAGPGPAWRTIQLAQGSHADFRGTGVRVAPDAGNVDAGRSGRPRLYYALPEVPSVARSASGTPVFSLVLMLSRAPAVGETSVHSLIQQSVASVELSFELPDRVRERVSSALELEPGEGRVEVRPLFVREAATRLVATPAAGSEPPTVLARARMSAGTAPRAALEAALDRDQTLALLGALEGAATNLVLASDVRYRVSSSGRRRLSCDWAAVYDFIASQRIPPATIARDELRSLFEQMVKEDLIAVSSEPAGAGAAQAERLFDAFARAATVILRRLTPDLAPADRANRYALRGRPAPGFRLDHEEEVSADALETIQFETPIEATLAGILDGLDRDAFIRLVSLAGPPGGGGGFAGPASPPRPQRFVQAGGARRDEDASAGNGDRARRDAGPDKIALALAEGELRPVALRLRPDARAAAGKDERNAQVMIASGFARPLAQAATARPGVHDWYLDDWRIQPQGTEKARHLPVVDDAAAPLWPDRISANTFWYAPVFEVLKPAGNVDPEQSPFLFRIRRIGESLSGPALEGEIRFTLRRGMSEQTRQALAARGNPAASEVPAGNLAVSLILPFINQDDNTLTRHTCPCTIAPDGTTLTATVALTTQWARIAYTLLSNPGASPEPARLSIAYTYEAYSTVRRVDFQLAVGIKEAMLPVAYSGAQRREFEGRAYLDAEASSLRFDAGAVHLPREAPRAAAQIPDAPSDPPLLERGGLATAAAVALAARPIAAARPEVAVRPAAVAATLPAVAGLGAIAKPELRPGVVLADLVRPTTYAQRTLLRQEPRDLAFPCDVLGALYREVLDSGESAIGCRPSMELGQVSYKRYQHVPELDSTLAGEPQFQVYRSLQQPGRFLVLPARYAITRHAPGTPDAYRPRVLLYSDEDPTHALETPIVFTADLQPDISWRDRRELELRLAALAQDPVVEYPTAIECEAVEFDFHAMDSTPVTPLVTPDSISISIGATAADWPLLYTRLKTGGVLGEARFDLGDGTMMRSSLTVDLRNIVGPWAGGAVTAERTAGAVMLANRIDRPIDVHDLLIVGGGAERRLPVERSIAAGGAIDLAVEPLEADAEMVPAYTSPATAEGLEAVPNAIERIHVNVLFVNQLHFANHALVAITVFARRLGAATFEQLQVLADTSVAEAEFLLPLTEYVERPVIELRLVKTFTDGHTETRDWSAWDLNTQGFVVSLTWASIQ